MPLHRVVKDSQCAVDDLDRVIERLESNGSRVVQVIDTPAEWLVVADAMPRNEFMTRIRADRP